MDGIEFLIIGIVAIVIILWGPNEDFGVFQSVGQR
jgi:hypothetical protein